ncbi:MAG: cystathionine beta-synthase [Acidimicrobiales bacterium]
MTPQPDGDDDLPAEPQIAGSLLDLIGDTPLLRLGKTADGIRGTIALKLEFFNPGGSVKDRPAVAMIEAAEREGLLRPGGTIVEPTSGNTGVGLAIVAAQRGYRCIFVMTDKVAPEKASLLRAFGAEVIVCPVAVEPDDPSSYYSVAERLMREIPGAYRPNQYGNPWNPWAHEQSTGPEVWRQTAGRITHFVAGIGTGGTITGVARYLKRQNPDIQIVGADPAGSVYSGGSGRPYLVEGIGEDFWPTTYDPSLVDRVIPISDEDSFLTARRVTHEEGIFIGGSGGTVVAAALHLAREGGPDDLVVVLIPDSGRGYLSRVFDDEWMATYGFLRAGDRTLGEVIEARGEAIPPLVYVHPEDPVERAVSLMREYDVSQLPVAKGEMPLATAEIFGAVDELVLMDLAFRDPGVFRTPVEKVMGPRLPTIGIGQPIELAVELLERSPALVVLAGGRPMVVLSRSDVLKFLSGQPSATPSAGGAVEDPE